MLHVVFDVASGATTATTTGQIRSKVRIGRTLVVVVVVTGSGVRVVTVAAVVLVWNRLKMSMGRGGILLLGLLLRLWLLLRGLRWLHRRGEILQGTLAVRRFLALGWIVRFVFDRCGPPWFINVPVDAGVLRIMTLRCVRHLQLVCLVLVLLDLGGVRRKSIVMQRPLQYPNENVHAFLFLGTTDRSHQCYRRYQIQQLDKQSSNVLLLLMPDRFHRCQHDVRQFIKDWTELSPGSTSG